MPEISVIIPSHNPRPDYLRSVLEALRDQSLPVSRWELLLIDNRSDVPLRNTVDFAWHPHATVIREESLGLTAARLAGFGSMTGATAVLVDDDNVLGQSYLEKALDIATGFPFLGAWGGVIEPRFETPESAPPPSLYPLLTLRTATRDIWSNDPDHHASTPWGAGLCVRKSVAVQYATELSTSESRRRLDLQGQRLLYGGDTDIAYTACSMGLAKGVFASLKVEHLIPAARCSPEYICRVAEGRGYSEVLHQFAREGNVRREPFSMTSWLRRSYRRLRMNAIERAASDAQERGRRSATRELSAAL